MATVPEYLDALQHQQRAARYAVTLPLAVHTLALVFLLAVHGRRGRIGSLFLQVLVPVAVYLLLLVLSRVRARLTGIGGGRDGYGIMALVVVGLLVLFPLGLMTASFLGAPTVLGVGLIVVGTRLRERILWVTGLVLGVISPFIALYTFDNHARFLGPRPGMVVLAALTAGLAVLTLVAFLRERRDGHRPVPIDT